MISHAFFPVLTFCETGLGGLSRRHLPRLNAICWLVYIISKEGQLSWDTLFRPVLARIVTRVSGTLQPWSLARALIVSR